VASVRAPVSPVPFYFLRVDVLAFGAIMSVCDAVPGFDLIVLEHRSRSAVAAFAVRERHSAIRAVCIDALRSAALLLCAR
jgi:hypothetical protein